jgi:hypothetical protein
VWVVAGWGAWEPAKAWAEHGCGWWVAFSVDRLIPFLTLDKAHALDLLHGWQRGYFFFVHQGLGAVLTFFVAAGLTGVTKR